MPSRRWKLSATIVINAFIAIPAVADELQVAMRCTYIAALSFADQEAEAAATVAKTAMKSCQFTIQEAVSAKFKGAEKSGARVTQSDIDGTVREAIFDEAQSFVIEMRSLAKQRGPEFYREAAERLAKPTE